MLEFGVVSGFSYANILHFADKLGLLKDQDTFLQSFDLDDGSLSGKKVGGFVEDYYPNLLPNWKFYPGKKSLDLIKNPLDCLGNIGEIKNALVFVDAGHNQPWPAIDLISIYKNFNRKESKFRGQWVMLQDVRMMERWIMDCVRFNVASPHPVRGVEHAYALWPGKKFSGINICFNMAAISLDVTKDDFVSYWKKILNYDFECNVSRSEIEVIFFQMCV